MAEEKRIASWWEQLNGRDLGRTGSGRFNDIKTYLTEIGWERIDWINLRVVAADGLL